MYSHKNAEIPKPFVFKGFRDSVWRRERDSNPRIAINHHTSLKFPYFTLYIFLKVLIKSLVNKGFQEIVSFFVL